MLALLLSMPAMASDQDAGNVERREVVAEVNGEEIFLDDLREAVAARHQNMDKDTPTAWVGYAGALDRLINTTLVIQEAMGISRSGKRFSFTGIRSWLS